MSAGYSKTPLAKKLGIKPGCKMKLINAPGHYFSLFEDLPEICIEEDKKVQRDFIHFFALNANELVEVLPGLRSEIVPNGMIWVSWPKKSSGVSSDVGEDLIRNTALANGLVDIKVCAIDDVWSGLKLVIPVSQR